eukprot:gene17580-biopygen11950
MLGSKCLTKTGNPCKIPAATEGSSPESFCDETGCPPRARPPARACRPGAAGGPACRAGDASGCGCSAGGACPRPRPRSRPPPQPWLLALAPAPASASASDRPRAAGPQPPPQPRLRQLIARGGPQCAYAHVRVCIRVCVRTFAL